MNRCWNICTNNKMNKCFLFEFLIVFISMLFIAAMLAMTVFSFLCSSGF